MYLMSVGILALQGDFAEHATIMRSLQQEAREIRSLSDLRSPISHLIIPGGESTVMARFLKETGVGEWIREQGRNGSLAILGTCAGAILLATEVTGKHPPHTLGLIDITVDRNAYGTQRDSFDTHLSVQGIAQPIAAAFIRAPRITRVGQHVDILATQNGDPVLVRSGRMLAGTFHPEVRGDTALHQFFLSL